MKVRIEKATRQQKEEAIAYAKKWLDSVMPKVARNVEAIILLQLHEQLGFGKKRLQRFLDGTAPMITQMLEDYNWSSDEDAIWLCEHRLKKEVGIDLSEINSPFSAKVSIK